MSFDKVYWTLVALSSIALFTYLYFDGVPDALATIVFCVIAIPTIWFQKKTHGL